MDVEPETGCYRIYHNGDLLLVHPHNRILAAKLTSTEEPMSSRCRFWLGIWLSNNIQAGSMRMC
jgi:hypothetical protein